MKQKIGYHIKPFALTSTTNQPVSIPNQGKFTHFQFRRFAGCPICNLHIHSLYKRRHEIQAAGIHEVIVFHASQENMLENTFASGIPLTGFDFIADPDKQLYKQFGLQNSWKALLHPSVIPAAVKGVLANGYAKPEKLETELVVPADFLISEKGYIVAMSYGTHANDQWSVDELLNITSLHS